MPAQEPTVVNSEWLRLDPTPLLNNTSTSVENAQGQTLVVVFARILLYLCIYLCSLYICYFLSFCKCVSGSELRCNGRADG